MAWRADWKRQWAMWDVPRWSHYGGERVYDWNEFYKNRVEMPKRKKEERQAKDTKRAAVQKQTSTVSDAEAENLQREVVWEAGDARI